MKIYIPLEIQDSWSSYKHKFNPVNEEGSYSSSSNVLGHRLHWIVPEDILWLYATNNKEDYEGSQTQIGIKRDGTVVFGFFSHCSCFGYEDYKGKYEELSEDNLKQIQHNYEMKNVEEDVLVILKDRLNKILELGLKDKEEDGGNDKNNS